MASCCTIESNCTTLVVNSVGCRTTKVSRDSCNMHIVVIISLNLYGAIVEHIVGCRSMIVVVTLVAVTHSSTNIDRLASSGNCLVCDSSTVSEILDKIIQLGRTVNLVSRSATEATANHNSRSKVRFLDCNCTLGGVLQVGYILRIVVSYSTTNIYMCYSRGRNATLANYEWTIVYYLVGICAANISHSCTYIGQCTTE